MTFQEDVRMVRILKACPNCGEELRDGFTYRNCYKCGHSFSIIHGKLHIFRKKWIPFKPKEIIEKVIFT